MICPICKGTGEGFPEPEVCKTCGSLAGQGNLLDYMMGSHAPQRATCPDCGIPNLRNILSRSDIEIRNLKDYIEFLQRRVEELEAERARNIRFGTKYDNPAYDAFRKV